MANEARKIQMAQVKLQKTLTAFITVMGTDAKNHFVKSFRNQGFEDDSIQKWKPRKGEIMGSGIAKVTKKSKSSRAILVKSGDLRRSVRVISKSYRSIVIGSDLPYAQRHNDGEKIGYSYVRPHDRKHFFSTTVKGGFQGTYVKRRSKKIEIIGSIDKVRGHSRKLRMPKRQFIGHSNKLIRQLRAKLDSRIVNVFK